MIQRIQSLYFFTATLLLSLSFASSYFTFNVNNQAYDVTSCGINHLAQKVIVEKPQLFWVPIALQIVVLLLTIFMYKNRKRQLKFAWGAFFINVATSVWVFATAYSFFKAQTTSNPADFNMEMGFFSHASAFLFIFLGIKAVRKDKNLIDSLNRLR
jgi:hypothetical protein